MANAMLSQCGRPDAQSTVLILSNGKYPLQYQTAEKAKEHNDKKVQVFMVSTMLT